MHSNPLGRTLAAMPEPMQTVSKLRNYRFALAFLGILAAGATTMEATAQDDQDPVLNAWSEFPEVVGCAQCHYEVQAASSAPTGPFAKRGDFSRQNELREWVTSDKHAIARLRVEPLGPANQETLRGQIVEKYKIDDPAQTSQWLGESNELSLSICEKIGIDVSNPSGYASFANQCLTCHGGFSGQDVSPPRFESYLSTTNPQPGIDCLYCHQVENFPSSGSTEAAPWIANHFAPGNKRNYPWRILPPEAKAVEGMRDLVTVSKQADLCNDCHIGNINKKMFVTHQMYAAGHPPLPNVELETFSQSMPPHWRTQGDLNQAMKDSLYEGRALYFAANFPGLVAQLPASNKSIDQVFWNTRNMLIGATAAKRRSIELVADAVGSANADGSGDYWGDYALYDCGACHHELRQPSARQQRGYHGAPGRPRLNEWSDAIFGLVANKELESEKSLANAVSAQPFGTKLEVGEKANELVNDLNKAIASLESRIVISAEFAIKQIDAFSQASQDQLLDYGAARQIMWAIMVMKDELANEPES